MGVGSLQLFQVLRFSVLILIGILLVKAGYDLDEIASYELFFFLANVVSFFWAMGLNNGLISYYPSLDEQRKKVLLFNLAVLLIILGLASGLLFYLLKKQVAALLGSEQFLDHVALIIAYMVLSAPANFTEYIYLLKGQTEKISSYGVVLFTTQLAAMATGIYLGFSIRGLLMIMLVWAAVKFIWFAIEVIRNSSLSLDWKLQRTFFLFSLPLIFHMLLGNGMEYVDGFLVTNFFDESVFAQFRYGARELPLVTVLIGAISTALIPIAVQNMMGAMKDVKRRIQRVMNILFPISICLMLISPLAFPFFYNDDYRVSAQIFNVYLLVLSSRILMPQVVLFAKHENKVLMSSALVELVVNIGLSLLFLKYFGVLGIAWATVVAYMVNKIILASVAWRKYGIGPSYYMNGKLYGIWLSLLLFSYYISTWYS